MMQSSLLFRISRASATSHQLSCLRKRLLGYWHWRRFIPTSAILLVISVIVITLTGCTASSYSTNYVISSSTLCQSCHGTGKVGYIPEEERITTEAEQGILTVNEERDRHKDLLDDWKKSVVRQGNTIYVASDGQEYKMSLTTCLKCHPNKPEFCDQCHSYVKVRPNCWNCHNLPEED